MFVIIKYGDDLTALLNPNCRMSIFRAWLTQKCGMAPNEVVDLCDEKGNLKQLDFRDHSAFVSTFLEYRETYVPVTLAKSASGKITHASVFLTSVDSQNLQTTLNEVNRIGNVKSKFKKLTKKSAISKTLRSLSIPPKKGKAVSG